MSQAFVKETEEQWLHDIHPTVNSLVSYLTRENNGVRVYELKSTVRKSDYREIYSMSNGLSYAKDDNGKWFVV